MVKKTPIRSYVLMKLYGDRSKIIYFYIVVYVKWIRLQNRIAPPIKGKWIDCKNPGIMAWGTHFT